MASEQLGAQSTNREFPSWPSAEDPHAAARALRLDTSAIGDDTADAAMIEPRLPAHEHAFADPAEFFESMYRCAEYNPERVPWADCRANPLLVAWLNERACGLVRPGARAVVVGCGLGDDVAELSRRGYDVTGFDISPTAIDWASKRHHGLCDCFCVADLQRLPGRMSGRFDLVVEAYTLQSVPAIYRAAMCRGLGQLLTPRGVLLILARARADDQPMDVWDGPPWPLSCAEVRGMMAQAGLHSEGCLEHVPDPIEPGVTRLMGVFRHLDA
ncbi:MAG: SAM-dependent methyltransferase [Planctomyces sp.]|nr:SAM-dependent methyltransferase [Planctomyces sp.]MBA4039235.1 SAM-dependent methyltransferase [Planctomyces sp.]MBA4120291.1 SAM-dependent methyltransferase [Isosphaera sp.]